jgi:uncharacterized protein YfaT (DUF1175 family)
MSFNFIVFYINGDIRHMQIVVGKIFFDHISLVTKTDNEIVKTEMGIIFHYMP